MTSHAPLAARLHRQPHSLIAKQLHDAGVVLDPSRGSALGGDP